MAFNNRMGVALADYIEIGCECCHDQYALWMVMGGPPPPRPNPQPENKGVMHRDFMQCQYCFKSRSEGATFFRCGGCSIEIYCVRALPYPPPVPLRLPV